MFILAFLRFKCRTIMCWNPWLSHTSRTTRRRRPETGDEIVVDRYNAETSWQHVCGPTCWYVIAFVRWLYVQRIRLFFNRLIRLFVDGSKTRTLCGVGPPVWTAANYSPTLYSISCTCACWCVCVCACVLCTLPSVCKRVMVRLYTLIRTCNVQCSPIL